MSPAGNLIITIEADGGVTTKHLNGVIDVPP